MYSIVKPGTIGQYMEKISTISVFPRFSTKKSINNPILMKLRQIIQTIFYPKLYIITGINTVIVDKFLKIVEKIISSDTINNSNIQLIPNLALNRSRNINRGKNKIYEKKLEPIINRQHKNYLNKSIRNNIIEIYILIYLMIFNFDFIPSINYVSITENSENPKEGPSIKYYMDRINGVSLFSIKSYTYNNSSVGYNSFIEYLLKVCKNLVKLQEKEIIHGDFKNDNILIDDEGNIHFIDFGCASIIRYDGQLISIKRPGSIDTPYELDMRKYPDLKAYDLLILLFSIYDTIQFKSKNSQIPTNDNSICKLIKNIYIFDLEEIYKFCDQCRPKLIPLILIPLILMYALLIIICIGIKEIEYICLDQEFRIKLKDKSFSISSKDNKIVREIKYERGNLQFFYPEFMMKYNSSIQLIEPEYIKTDTLIL
jgi:serine/threonine protein kinase